MKNYYLILIEHFIGIGYLILFFIGSFANYTTLYYTGGIGMFLFILIMVKGQPKNLSSFLFMCLLGSIIAYFISNWWSGLFWMSAIFTVGQIFGMSALIKSKDHIRNMHVLDFARSGMESDPDRLEVIDIILFVVLLTAPYLLQLL